MARKPTLPPPRPDFIRMPTQRFGWLDDRLLKEGWLQRLGPEPTAVLVLLALAADRHGASFYGRERMAVKLGVDRNTIDRSLNRLLQLGLVAHRPWRPDHPDGIWQILPVPQNSTERPTARKTQRGPGSLADTLKQLGFSSPQTKPPESRAS